MRLEDIKAPPITPESRERVAALLGRAADVADLLQMIFPNEETTAPAPTSHLRAVPASDKKRGAVAG